MANVYKSAGAAAAAASPINPVKLDYFDWKEATIESYPGENPQEQAADTTVKAYATYMAIWEICQIMRLQPGVAAQDDALLAQMAEV